MPRIAYVNGRYVPHGAASVHIEDRGYQFADSVYEVVALINGKLADEQGHLDRLERSLDELEIDMPMSRAALKIAMRHLVHRNRCKNGGLYIQVTRGVAPRDFKFPDNDPPPSIVMTLRNMSFDIDARKKTLRDIITLPDIRWKRVDIKTTGLLAQVLAKQTALDAGAYDAWIVNDKGHLITRPTANNRILKGVTRSALQALCKKHKIKLIERAFTVAEAKKAKEAFTSSATALVMPVGSIDGKKIGKGTIGPVTEKVFDLYVAYAGLDKQEKWDPK